MDDSLANEDTRVQREEPDNKMTVWTPEDASRFLASAINEAQRPLADALKRPSVSPGIVVLIVVLLVAAASAIGWVLLRQLDKSERAADTARTARDAAVNQWHELQAKSEGLTAKLSAEMEQQERLRREYLAETEHLKTIAAGHRDNEEELKRIKGEMQRHRRQNELLRNQISGLEMEKQALARQLEAVKALALGEDDGFAAPDASAETPADSVTIEEPPVPGPASVPTPTPTPATNVTAVAVNRSEASEPVAAPDPEAEAESNPLPEPDPGAGIVQPEANADSPSGEER